MGLHRFRRGDVVHAKRDLRKKVGKGIFATVETVVLEGTRGIVLADQTMFGTRVPVEFSTGRALEVSTDLLVVEHKQFSLLP